MEDLQEEGEEEQAGRFRRIKTALPMKRTTNPAESSKLVLGYIPRVQPYPGTAMPGSIYPTHPRVQPYPGTAMPGSVYLTSP